MFLGAIQILVAIMTLICYPMVLLRGSSDWIVLFYLFLAVVIMAEAVFALVNLRKILNLFRRSQRNSSILTAKRYILGVYLLIASIFVWSVAQMFFFASKCCHRYRTSTLR